MRLNQALRKKKERGAALLTVLWLTAALAMVVLSVASTVRGEIERSLAQQESLRAYYLARGAVERQLFRLRDAPATGLPFEALLLANRRSFQRFVGGDVLVELVSEQGKMPLAGLRPELLERLLLLNGATSQQASLAVNSFFQNGTLQNGGAAALATTWANTSASGGQTFSPARASLENVEELMLFPGFTSQIVHGRFERLPNGRLAQVGGLEDCLSPLAEAGQGLDVWSVHPTLLVALGMDQTSAYQLAEARALPWANAQQSVAEFLALNRPPVPLVSNRMGNAFQVRATARVRTPAGTLSDTRRSVSLLVKQTPPPPQFFWREGLSYMRWYDNAYSDIAAQAAAWLETGAAN
ncbi:MAG: hypothetical protein NW208_10425 [Bryobacter sp.]|nr:hypothetical protein [Bryobacter sp.]